MTEEQENKPTSNIVFFCRDCQKVVAKPEKVGAKYIYKCSVCKGDDVAFGTKKSICDYFHLKEKDLT